MPALLWLLPLLLASATSAGPVNKDRGFMLVAPKVWRAGSRERLCVTLFNINSTPSDDRVTLDEPFAVPVKREEPRRRSSLSSVLNLLRNRQGRTPRPEPAISFDSTDRNMGQRLKINSGREVTVNIRFHTRGGSITRTSRGGSIKYEEDKRLPVGWGAVTSCFYISLPDSLTANYISVIVPNYKPVYSQIRVERKVLVTLVQTDKAKYRPGQTVKLRVVSLRQDFTALDDTIKEIWITAPEGTRLAQWLNVRMNTGLVQKEFKLAEEPPLGLWTIHVKREDGAITKQPFRVQEYVPPRFELSVSVPGTIYRDSTVLTVNVCAKYTFGKPLVSADVQLKISASRPNVFKTAASVPEVIGGQIDDEQNDYSEKTDSNGCASIYIVLSKIRTSSGAITHDATQYLVTANVTEDSTDISQVSELVVPVRETKLFKVIKDESPKFFKPDMEYYGTVLFTRQDGSPVKNEQVEICYVVSYYHNIDKKSSNSFPTIIGEFSTSSRSSKCETYRTDSSGRVVFVVPPQRDEVSKISFKGSVLSNGQSFTLQSVVAWYSASGSFLMIDSRDLLDGGRCGQSVAISVRRSGSLRNARLQYLVMSRGDVVSDGTVSNGPVRFTLLSKMSPSFRLLVYTVTNEGEVVADSKMIRVTPCLPNKVSVSWSAAEVRPGGTASLTITGSPGSLCGVDAVDRSAQLLGTSNAITIQKVFSQVSRLMIREQALPRLTQSSSNYCPLSRTVSDEPSCDAVQDRTGTYVVRDSIPYEERRIQYTLDKRSDSVAAFDEAGFLAVTNLALQTRPCVERVTTFTYYKTCRTHYPRKATSIAQVGRAIRGSDNVVSGSASIDTTVNTSSGITGNAMPSIGAKSGGVKTITSRDLQPSKSSVSVDGASATVVEPGASCVPGACGASVSEKSTKTQEPQEPEESQEPPEPVVRLFFPETFINRLEAIGSSGQTRLTQQLPDSITKWIGSAVCSHRQVGLGISAPASIKVFKPFFAEINVPYSVKRGELLQLKVSVFNFLSTDLSVVLQLEDVPGVQLEGGRQRALCVSADRPSVSTFPVTFTELDRVSLVVSVRAKGTACGRPNTIDAQSDALVRDILVKPEGFPQEEALTERICIKGGSKNHVFELGSSPRVVPGSARAVVSIYGDPLGQAITQLTGLKSLVRVPHGCGEQNMVLLVPNILVHQYLKAKNLLSSELKRKTIDNMRDGYQRQLRYRHSDGSYSAFGQNRWSRRKGSLWLTVYVLRWFAVARKFVDIDMTDLAASRRWVERQQRSDGCFSHIGWMYDKAMTGGVADGGRLALTAFTVLALLEADAGSSALRRAVSCLRDGRPNGLYAEVLVTHALLEAGERSAAVPGLLRRAIRDKDSLHWRSERSNRWSGGSALDVEITAYAAQILLRLEGHGDDARAAIRWLDRRRNGHGGWVSTQDTVVALSAMVAAEKRSGELAVRQVDVTVVSGSQFRHTFQVTTKNRLLHQQAELRPLPLPTSVSVTATGTGCIMAQTTMRYSLQETKAKQAFKINHDIRPVRRGLCQSFILQICASYIAADSASNMAIIEVEMLSGFTAIDHVLQQLERQNVIRRWEMRQSVLALYFDQLVQKTLCFDLSVLQETVVQRLRPATIAVYDYYTTENRLETEYKLPDCQ